MVTNASIKDNVVTFITHIYIHDRPIIKTLHYAVNITTTEAKLFTIRYSINQAINIKDILKIVIITDSLHIA